MRSRGSAVVATVIVAAVLASGCSSDDDRTATTTTARPTTTVTTTTAAASTTIAAGPGRAIAAVDFRNFTYDLSDGSDSPAPATVTVTDGSFDRETDDDKLYFEVRDVVVSDLDGDGEAEAAVSIYYTTGGTGQFTDVLVYRWNGADAALVTSDGVGDRGDGGVVSVAAATGAGTGLLVQRNAENEGACCPTVIEERTLALQGDRLVTVGAARRWGIVRLGVDTETKYPVAVKFLAGADRARIEGDATKPVSATFDATANQQVSLSLDPVDEPEHYVTMTITAPDGTEVLRIGPAKPLTGSWTLPVTGTYTLDVRADFEVDPSLGAYFGALLVVG
ncbi:MAG: hypothetical protein U0Q22_12515 [Acidimicrobiales bacterium]